MNPQNSNALKLFRKAFKGVEMIDQYKPLSIAGKFEALLFNSLLTLSTYQKKCSTAQDYSKTEEEFMQLVVMVAKEHNLLHRIDDLASFINNRMSFYDEEFYNLTSGSNYIPGKIYDAFYINPLATQPQMNNDLSVILIFQQSLKK